MNATGEMDKPRRRLFWRVYRNGLLLLVILAVLVGLAVHATGDAPPWKEAPRRLASLLAEALDSRMDQGRSIQRQLDEIHALLQIDLAVFDAAGRRLAEAAARPLDPLSPARLADLRKQDVFHGDGRLLVALPLRPGGVDSGYLVMGFVHQRGLIGLVAILLAILAGLALASYPLARALTRPLEQLTEAARALAGGDLSARTGVDRKDELGVLARTMDHMADRLATRLRSERELLANISHEIRTPLARLRVALELGEDEGGDAEAVRRRLAAMGQDVAELEDLIERVLTAARLDLAAGAAGLAPRLAEVDLAGLIADQLSRFATRHPDARERTSLRAAPDLPRIQADPELLGRVLANLLDNAARYAGPEADIQIGLSADPEGLRIAVRDSGPGVPEADLSLLFEPFARAERSRDRRGGGVGLGLTLCKRIVEAHGGRIAAHRLADGGFEMRIVLPAGPASP